MEKKIKLDYVPFINCSLMQLWVLVFGLPVQFGYLYSLYNVLSATEDETHSGSTDSSIRQNSSVEFPFFVPGEKYKLTLSEGG